MVGKKPNVEEVDNLAFELDAVHTPAGITFTFLFNKITPKERST